MAEDIGGGLTIRAEEAAPMATSNLRFGYARVSTDGQSLAAQEIALKDAGARKIFAEKISGARSDRNQLAKAIETLGKGDVLLITRLVIAKTYKAAVPRRGAEAACRCRCRHR